MAIKGFVFDMDGVLTETASLHYRAWRDEVKPLGIDFTEEENATLKGLPRYDTLRAILKMHNVEVSEEQIIEMGDHKNEAYLKMLKTELSDENILPGIPEFLKKAKAEGIKTVVASSSHNAPLILEMTDLMKHFDHVVNPGSIKNGKPAPDIYLAAIKAIDLKPEEVIGFEDAISGVQGLVESKIKTVAITWGDEANWSIADMVIHSTKDLDFNKIINL